MRRSTWLAAGAVSLISSAASARTQSVPVGGPPAGFLSAFATVNGARVHYVQGGRGPAVILLHGFPEDWAVYRRIMPRLAKRFTVIAVDLPGLGKSAPAAHGYYAASLAADIHGLAESLKLDRPYVVDHDLGAHVTYAYLRAFPDSVRGAMIMDTPMPGLAGWDEATTGGWHIGFIQVPGLAEKLVPGRQSAFLGWFLDLGRFTPAERSHFIGAYRAPQLHAAFKIFRAFPKNLEWNAAQNSSNPVPLTVAVGEKFLLAKLMPKFVEGYRARGMTCVDSVLIPNSGHYVVADNPDAVAGLIEQHGGAEAK